MKDKQNCKWTIQDIAEEYKKENSNWSWSKCWKKAKKIYKELNKLNYKSYYNDKIFFKYNKPFSYFENKNDEFEDTYYDWDT